MTDRLGGHSPGHERRLLRPSLSHVAQTQHYQPAIGVDHTAQTAQNVGYRCNTADCQRGEYATLTGQRSEKYVIEAYLFHIG